MQFRFEARSFDYREMFDGSMDAHWRLGFASVASRKRINGIVDLFADRQASVLRSDVHPSSHKRV